MLTFIKSPRLATVAYLALATTILAVGWQLMSINMAEARNITTASTTNVHLEKKFSGPVPAGYTPDMFYFTVSGGLLTSPQTVTLVDGNDGTADGYIDLPVGVYTVTEHGPASFIPGEWRPGWYEGTECAASTNFFTTLNITEDTIENRPNIGCQVDNQWRPGKLTVEKIIIGTSTSPADFDFTVIQGNDVRYNGPFVTADGIRGSNLIYIAKGDYSVVEDNYTGYTTTYTVSGGASNSNGCTGTIAQGGSATCRITNTYTGNGENGGGDEDGTTGVLVVQKVIAGTTTVPFTNFSFSYTGASGTTTFDVSGTNNLLVATGTYSVTETPTTDYVTTYENCTDVEVSVNATSTCVITNTLKTDDNGGGDNEGDDYRLQGYVWHDNNENGIWDEDEDPLPDWTVHLTGSSSSRSTTTDSNGYYFFIVDEGTWTLSETVKTDWAQTHPTPTTYVVTVPEEQLTLRFPFNYLFSIAHAETINVNGDFNFGNVFKGGGGISGGGGGGGSSSGTKTDRNNDSTSSTPAPTPLVLGEQVSPVPMGGADAGAGGTYPSSTPVTPLLLAAIMYAITLVRNRELTQ